MSHTSSVLEFKCPCCNAPLIFDGNTEQLTCAYCDNSFDIETLQACKESEAPDSPADIQWDCKSENHWNQEDQNHLRVFLCQACGGELISDSNTAATFCPYCGNPAILPERFSGGLKPDGIIPFKTTKEDAKSAFLKLCSGKLLLPKSFKQDQQIDKITGIYVPFWLYDCSADLNGSYKATRTHTWSDSRFIYTKTDHYLLRRQADADYKGIPMDGSSKMQDSFMESIEPFDYGDIQNFDMAYLSGFFADKYDVESSAGEERIRQRVETSMNDHMQSSFLGYSTVIPTSRNIRIEHGKARYVLLPVWLLSTKYQDKVYTFAMNGQTGKMTGSFPVCSKRSAAWFFGLWAISSALVSVIQLLL